MADNKDNSEMNNFSIDDTINEGAGSQELINDLFGEGAAGASPDEITPIKKDGEEEIINKVIPKKPDETAPKPADKPDTAIADFLLGDETADAGMDTDTDDSTDDSTDDGTTDTDDITDTNTDDADGGEENTPFETLSKELTELGVFSELKEGEDPITSPEQFLEKFQAEKQQGANEIVDNFIGQFGEDYQNAFDAIFVKGADPKEYFGAMSKVEDFTNMDMTQESNQKLVLKQALINQGFEGEDIDLEIERLNNYGDLETVSQRHHKVLIKKEAEGLQAIQEKARVDSERKTAIKTEYTQNVRTVLNEKLKEKGFDGIPLNPKLANELHDFLLVDKYKTPSGETLTDFDRTILDLKRPENHATKVKVGLLLKMLESDPTLSTIQKTGITKKTNKLFNEVAKQVHSPKNKSNNKGAAPRRWFK